MTGSRMIDILYLEKDFLSMGKIVFIFIIISDFSGKSLEDITIVLCQILRSEKIENPRMKISQAVTMVISQE